MTHGKQDLNPPPAADVSLGASAPFQFPAPLRQAQADIQAMLGPRLEKLNAESVRHKALHGVIARIAIAAGTVAVVAAITQLAGASADSVSSAGWAEIIAILLCVMAVVFGVTTSRQLRWLSRRLAAQRCESLQFRALAWPSLWAGDFQSWSAALKSEIPQILDVNSARQIRSWLESEPLPTAPATDISADRQPALQALKDFYARQRIEKQIAYYARSATEHGRRAHTLHHLPSWCFFGSVVLALVHFSLEHFFRERFHALGRWLIVFAAVLPVLGAAFRSWLMAFEFSRSASLYRAKGAALVQFQHKLAQAEGAQVLAVIAECEAYLEDEQREWLRLVAEAEWFG